MGQRKREGTEKGKDWKWERWNNGTEGDGERKEEIERTQGKGRQERAGWGLMGIRVVKSKYRVCPVTKCFITF